MNTAATGSVSGGALLSTQEQQRAATLLTLAMLALGLFALALAWKLLAPDNDAVSQILFGTAALIVAVPVLRAGWHSLTHPDLHGITDLLIAVAMLGAWALGDLMTAVLLPVIMIFGHVLEERSVIGSHEAISALGRLTHSRARVRWFVTNNAQAMLAVLVAACPCALARSAPATAIAGIAVAARHGILIRGSAFLEELAETSALIVDKTGTLTTGALRLQSFAAHAGVDTASALHLAGSLGAASTHPVSRALAALVSNKERWTLDNVRERPGLGVVGETERGEAALGRPELLAQLGIETSPVPTHDGPIAGLALDGRFFGWLLLADTPRPEAAAAMADLRDLGVLRQILLTGDRLSVAEALARSLGIAEVQAQALREDKLNRVIAEKKRGFRPLVVGDGVNDSLALKGGGVGIAMGAGGSDIALASADVVLIGSDLRRLGTCIRFSRIWRRVLHAHLPIRLES